MHKLAWLGLFAALQLGAADPRIGSWTLISAQSSLDPPNKLTITSLHGTVHVVMSGDTHLDFAAKLDGHEASVQGIPAFNQIELRRIDKHQVEIKEKKDGAAVAAACAKGSSQLSHRGRPIDVCEIGQRLAQRFFRTLTVADVHYRSDKFDAFRFII